MEQLFLEMLDTLKFILQLWSSFPTAVPASGTKFFADVCYRQCMCLIVHDRSFAATSTTLVLSSYLCAPFKLCSRVVTCKEAEYILDWNSCC
eukprot:Em0007g1223a